MKKFMAILFLMVPFGLLAQLEPNNHESSFELGEGINFNFQEGAYQFRIGGMIQPQIRTFQIQGEETEYFFNAKRTYLNFGGMAKEEKVGFFFQLDFSQRDPLLDAWLSYQPIKQLTITAGQKQNVANNREMLIMEDQLQFPDRSILSTSFSRTGREFGLFLKSDLGNESFKIIPQLSLTSGDGRNSFGVDSRDVDLGGFKYSGRLDIMPLGDFTNGNANQVADLMHEEKLKFIVGAAVSYNDGASDQVGEEHGNFLLYNGAGEVQLPDYRQFYGDILAKYKGFSLLGEYVMASATSLQGTFINATVDEPLLATQISEYLVLGSAFNAQLGYVTKNGYALDARYGIVTPEFSENSSSILQEANSWTIGFTKYFKGQNLKIQTAYSTTDFQSESQKPQSSFEFLAQLRF